MKIVLFNKGSEPVLKLPVQAVQYILRNLPQRLEVNRILYDKIMEALRSSDGEEVDLSGIYEVNSMEFRTNPVFVAAVEKYDKDSKFVIYNSPCEWFTIDNFFSDKETVIIPDLTGFVQCSEAARRSYGW